MARVPRPRRARKPRALERTVENARLYADAERRRREAESLAEVGRLLSHSLEPREVAQRIVDHVLALFPVRAAILSELVPGGSALRVVTAAGDSGLFAPGATFPAGYGVMGIAVRDRQPVSTTDALSDARVALTPEARRWYEATGYRAVLALPFLVHDHVLGGLGLADTAGRVYTAEEVRMAQAFADQAAVALDNARLYVVKDASATELLRAVRAAAAGKRYLSPPLSEGTIEAYLERAKTRPLDLYDTLTTREREVLHLAAEGHANPQIAARLDIGVRTVETHRANLMRKLALHSQTDLVRFALERGFLPREPGPIRPIRP